MVRNGRMEERQRESRYGRGCFATMSTQIEVTVGQSYKVILLWHTGAQYYKSDLLEKNTFMWGSQIQIPVLVK